MHWLCCHCLLNYFLYWYNLYLWVAVDAHALPWLCAELQKELKCVITVVLVSLQYGASLHCLLVGRLVHVRTYVPNTSLA